MNNEEFVSILKSIRKEAHEISNSLMIISGRSQLAESGDPEKIQKLIDIIDPEVNKMARCLENVYKITEQVINELEEND